MPIIMAEVIRDQLPARQPQMWEQGQPRSAELSSQHPTNLPPPQKGLQGAYLFDNIPKVTETRAEQVSRTRKRLGESEPPATLLVQEAVKCCSLEHEELLGLLVGQGDTWSKAQGLGCQGEWMNPCSDSGATDVCARDTWSKIHNTPSSSCPQGPCILP